jgi:predicted RNA binding protein YcfA (HicA-like mRNA interferase family)
VIKAFEQLGFHVVREGNHIAMSRDNPDGTKTPLTSQTTARLKVPPCVQFFLNAGFHEMTS